MVGESLRCLRARSTEAARHQGGGAAVLVAVGWCGREENVVNAKRNWNVRCSESPCSNIVQAVLLVSHGDSKCVLVSVSGKKRKQESDRHIQSSVARHSELHS